MSSHSELLDCIVIGAGAAGLTAAIYLARFQRRIAVIDGRTSRLLSIPASHNYPGFPNGIHGEDLLARLRAQAVEYGLAITNGTVDRLDRLGDGNFIAACGSQQWQARTAIIATGVVDVEPDFADVKRAVTKGCVRYCPICDGFEAIGKKVAVIGRGKDGLQEALFIRHFTPEVSLFSLTEPLMLTAQDQERITRSGVRAVHDPVERLALDEADLMKLYLRGDTQECFDVVYVALGTMVNSGIAQQLGANVTDNGELLVDAHQQTSVEGLYAAGDIVAGLNQITVAMGQATVAATAIHHRLNAYHA